MSLMFFLWICLFIPNVPHSFQPIDVSHIQNFMVQRPFMKGWSRKLARRYLPTYLVGGFINPVLALSHLVLFMIIHDYRSLSSMIQSVKIYDSPLFVCMTGIIPCINDLDSVGHSVSKTHSFIGSIIKTVSSAISLADLNTIG